MSDATLKIEVENTSPPSGEGNDDAAAQAVATAEAAAALAHTVAATAEHQAAESIRETEQDFETKWQTAMSKISEQETQIADLSHRVQSLTLKTEKTEETAVAAAVVATAAVEEILPEVKPHTVTQNQDVSEASQSEAEKDKAGEAVDHDQHSRRKSLSRI